MGGRSLVERKDGFLFLFQKKKKKLGQGWRRRAWKRAGVEGKIQD